MPLRSNALPFRLQVEALEHRDTPSTLYGLTADSRLARYDSATPTAPDSVVAIQGLNAGERVVGIDFRPRTAGLYAMAVNGNGTGTTARLLLVNPLTGASAAVGSGITLAAGDATGQYGFDFNPTVDRIRVINRAGANLRVNPNDGTVTADTNILLNGPVDAAAYDRNFDGRLGGAGTTLYTINPATGNLHTQGTVNQAVSPNTGLQTVVGPLGTPIDATGGVGFDIAANGTAAGGPAFAVFDGNTTAAVSTGLYTVNLTTGAATLVGLVGNGADRFVGLAVAPEGRMAVGSGSGREARVEVYDPFTGARLREIAPYPGFRGGVTTAVGDVNRDAVPDIITGAIGGGGGPLVKVFDGATGAEIASFFAYAEAFRGGVRVAAGDVNGDGFADIITGAGPGGGPHVRAFSGQDQSELASFFPYIEGFRGGVRVSVGDFNQDGVDEIVTGAGPGGGPHVRVFARDTVTGGIAPFVGGVSNSFFAYSQAFAGGVWVATGDVNGDGFTDIVTGADTGGGPHVRAFSGRDGAEIASFFAFNPNFDGGVRVGAGDHDRDGRVEILVAPAGGLSNQVVRAFDANTGTLVRSYDVVDGADSAFVGGGM
jgi:hypothetical protein